MKQKSLFLAIAVLLGLRITATAQTPPSYVPTDGLVGWWPFNGNANDESGNGNNGTVNGATLSLDRYNQPNRSFNFARSDHYIRVPNNESLSLDSNFCISLWFRAESTTAFNCFLSKSSCLNGNIPGYTCGLWDFFSGGQNPRVNFQAYPYLNDATPTLPQEISVIELNNWHHFVVTYEHLTNTMNYYLDNVFLESLEVNFEIDDTNLDLIIGNHLDVFNGLCESTFMIGSLDDIGIWNRALTQDEVNDLYNANLCYEYITVTDTLIINLGPTGFNPVTYSNTILMYPNPSNEQLTIDYGDYATLAGYTLKIFNGIGQEIHSANINQQQEVLPLGTWGGAGNYQVVIYNAQGVPVDTRTIVLQ
jgi:hypothetical protein